MLTLFQALKIAKEKEGYEQCNRKEHGIGRMITYRSKTAKATFAICPIIQFAPKPTYLFHNEQDFIESCEIYYKSRGWI